MICVPENVNLKIFLFLQNVLFYVMHSEIVIHLDERNFLAIQGERNLWESHRQIDHIFPYEFDVEIAKIQFDFDTVEFDLRVSIQ